LSNDFKALPLFFSNGLHRGTNETPQGFPQSQTACLAHATTVSGLETKNWMDLAPEKATARGMLLVRVEHTSFPSLISAFLHPSEDMMQTAKIGITTVRWFSMKLPWATHVPLDFSVVLQYLSR